MYTGDRSNSIVSGHQVLFSKRTNYHKKLKSKDITKKNLFNEVLQNGNPSVSEQKQPDTTQIFKMSTLVCCLPKGFGYYQDGSFYDRLQI